MGFLIGTLCVILLTVFIMQVAKARELASTVRADASEQYEINKFQAGFGMVFMVAFMVICVWSFIHYIPTSLGWGPNTAASEHGVDVDYLFNLTLFFTGIVFVLTHIALFWFSWKYRGQSGKKAIYFAHNETLEMVWMMIPAVVMAFLVIGGLQVWNSIMTDLPKDARSVILPAEGAENEFIEIEATGSQFLWYLRYPGRDGKLGKKYFTQINSDNPLGQTWTDEANIDDFMTNEVVLPKGRKVRVRITARDVLHNFYIKDMRVKMDAVPGMPTYFIFTPTVTTKEMRARLSEQPEWQVPDKNDDSKQRWETFNYELACAELCGKGHYSMRNLVKIVEVDEYLDWLDKQEGGKLVESEDEAGIKSYTFEEGSVKSQYLAKIYGKDGDPLKGNEKIKNLEMLVANKTLIANEWSKAKALRDAEEDGSDAYVRAEVAMAEIKTVLNKSRTTNELVESKELLNDAIGITSKLQPEVLSQRLTETEEKSN